MIAAIRTARAAAAAFVVVAAPVASDEAVALVGAEADELAILRVPPMLCAIGAWYRNFEQLEDADVRRLLALARENGGAPLAPAEGTA
jgi:predicted phosphoribosyltransferase